ncbi:unnamed protein product, partial [Ranitomeya imitator]
LIQTVSAVDKDEPPRGHTFFFEMLPEFSINPNFTVVDNKDNTASIFKQKETDTIVIKLVAYTLPVIIFDNDYPVQSSTETLTIQVCACDNKGNVQTCSAEAFFLPAEKVSTGAFSCNFTLHHHTSHISSHFCGSEETPKKRTINSFKG